MLEFLTVTVIKPIMSLDEATAAKLLLWHKETGKNERRRFKKKVVRPTNEEIFSSPRFTGFCHLYFHIATALGAFQVRPEVPKRGGSHFVTCFDFFSQLFELLD